MSGGRGLAPVMAPSPYCCPCSFSKLHPQQTSWSLPTQMRTETRSKFQLSIRTRKFPVLCRKFPVHSKNLPACSTGRSNFVTAWLYQSSRAIGISHIRHDQAIGPDDTRQRIDGLNAVHVYLSKHSPRSETSLRTCGRRLLASPCPSRMLAFTPRECRFN